MTNWIFATLFCVLSLTACSKKGYQKVAPNSISGMNDGLGQRSRKVVYRDKRMITAILSQSGTIVMSVCIDREGNVSSAALNKEETSITNSELLENALKAMKKYKYEADANAPEEECGRFTVTVDNREE